MFHTISFSKKLNVKQQYNARLSIGDLFIVLISSGIPWMLLSRFYPPVISVLPAFVGAIISFLLVSPSGIPDKKTYQVIWLVIRKPRKIYHSIDRPIYVRTFKEGD